MALDTASLIDLVVTTAELESGRRLEKTSPATSILSHMVVSRKKTKAAKWSPAEEDFLRRALGYMSEDDIALHLGRSKIAVHLRWKRDLGLPAPSKHPDVISAQLMARALGIDSHKTACWVDAGLIPGRLMPGRRKIRLTWRSSFLMWACAPRNWVYFDPKKVRDPHLKRLLRLEAKRWGDEWWTTRRVADYHGVTTSDVRRYVQLGKLPAYRLPVSLGGRDPNRYWSNWKILRSEATRPGFRFVHYGEDLSGLTPRGGAWLKKALKMGMNTVEIGRTMKVKPATVLNWAHRNFPKMVPPSGGTGHSVRHRAKNGLKRQRGRGGSCVL